MDAQRHISVLHRWGGELTRVGRAQAEDLGKRLRVAMYPGDEEGGLLRLHSTFRHDLKIYTSDEGRWVLMLSDEVMIQFRRKYSHFSSLMLMYLLLLPRCQVTSAAFTKGFLDLEGELTPILVQMVVRNAKAHALLDSAPIHMEARNRCKLLLDNMLNQVRLIFYD